MISKRTVLGAIAIACCMPIGAAFAQPKYPCDLVKFVVPYPPGGASDPMARMLIPTLNKRLGTSFIVENMPGASGSIGVNHVAAAKPDGCTLLLGGSSAVIVGRNLFKMPKDPIDALVPLAEISSLPMVLYVNPKVPANTVGELVKLLQESPGKYDYASPGSGTMHNLLAEMFKQRMKVTAAHIPYKGSGPAIQDVLAGHVAFSFESTSAIIPHLLAGKVKALATTGETRSAGLPNVPTMKELGYPELTVTNWYAAFAPKGTPQEVLTALNEAILEAQETKDVAEALQKMDSQHTRQTYQQFQQFVKSDAPRWERIVKSLGMKVE